MVVIDCGLPPLTKPTPEEMTDWQEWVKNRPPLVRELCEKFPPWHYYVMPKTGQIVTVESYSEDGTMRVSVVEDRISIPTLMPVEVFGVPAEDLIRRS